MCVLVSAFVDAAPRLCEPPAPAPAPAPVRSQTTIEWPLYATDREIVEVRRDGVSSLDTTTPRTIVGAFPESQRTAGINIAVPESHCIAKIVFHIGAWDGRATQLSRAVDAQVTFGETEIEVTGRMPSSGATVPVEKRLLSRRGAAGGGAAGAGAGAGAGAR